jgi:hypothetical protein
MSDEGHIHLTGNLDDSARDLLYFVYRNSYFSNYYWVERARRLSVSLSTLQLEQSLAITMS